MSSWNWRPNTTEIHSEKIKKAWIDNGFLVFHNFLPEHDCAFLHDRASTISADLHTDRSTVEFDAEEQSHANNERFTRSATTIDVFAEPDDPSQPNKLGHALHEQDTAFRQLSHDPRLVALCTVLGLVDPRPVQSMVIFKNPHVGGAVSPHQDATFLRTTPSSVIGFWFALQDATLDNGCLWVLPGHHRESAPRATFGTDHGPLELTVHNATPWPMDRAVPVEVAVGTLVVLHGQLPHFSHANRSSTPRPAYTLHVIDGSTQWHAANWIQRRTPFPRL